MRKKSETHHSLEYNRSLLKIKLPKYEYVSSCLKTRPSGHCYHVSGQNNTTIPEVFYF